MPRDKRMTATNCCGEMQSIRKWTGSTTQSLFFCNPRIFLTFGQQQIGFNFFSFCKLTIVNRDLQYFFEFLMMCTVCIQICLIFDTISHRGSTPPVGHCALGVIKTCPGKFMGSWTHTLLQEYLSLLIYPLNHFEKLFNFQLYRLHSIQLLRHLCLDQSGQVRKMMMQRRMMMMRRMMRRRRERISLSALGKVWAQRASGTFSISMNYLYTLSYCQTGGLFLDPRDRIGIRPG